LDDNLRWLDTHDGVGRGPSGLALRRLHAPVIGRFEETAGEGAGISRLPTSPGVAPWRSRRSMHTSDRTAG